MYGPTTAHKLLIEQALTYTFRIRRHARGSRLARSGTRPRAWPCHGRL